MLVENPGNPFSVQDLCTRIYLKLKNCKFKKKKAFFDVKMMGVLSAIRMSSMDKGELIGIYKF